MVPSPPAAMSLDSAAESSHGLFVCYAPAEDPQIAVAVVIEHGVWGAYTAPVARDVLMSYFRMSESGYTSSGTSAKPGAKTDTTTSGTAPDRIVVGKPEIIW